MNPKLNKLITLLLLLGTFAFLMEAERRISALATEELSKWASELPENDQTIPPIDPIDTLHLLDQQVSILELFAKEESQK